jgi:hypothetical protein
MIAYEFAQLERQPECRLLLTAYHARQIVAADGWVDRITEIEGVVSEQLSRMHGKLIALGLLEFELGDRTGGMRYQISLLGRQALRAPVDSEFESDAEEDSEEAAPSE